MAKRLNGHLKKAEISTLKLLLESETERILSSSSEKKAEYLKSIDEKNKDDVDSANDNILLSTDMRFSNREMLFLKKIEKALKRIDTEEFGMCDDCGASISYERLKARPTSEMCIVCKEESEMQENQSFYNRRSKSMGQTVTF